MTETDTPKPKRRTFWDNLSAEERSAHARMMRAKRRTNPGGFKAGDPRAVEAGRKGGKASGVSKRRNMKGVVHTRGDRYRGEEMQ